METILVTGGFGFIGSHTCLSLLEKGYHLIVVDSCVNSSEQVLIKLQNLSNRNCKLKYFNGDLRDISFLRRVFEEAKKCSKPITSVIHFAF